MNDEGRTQREINEGGEAGRGRAWSKRGRGIGGRELRRREGRRGVGRLGGRENTEGDK